MCDWSPLNLINFKPFFSTKQIYFTKEFGDSVVVSVLHLQTYLNFNDNIITALLTKEAIK